MQRTHYDFGPGLRWHTYDLGCGLLSVTHRLDCRPGEHRIAVYHFGTARQPTNEAFFTDDWQAAKRFALTGELPHPLWRSGTLCHDAWRRPPLDTPRLIC